MITYHYCLRLLLFSLLSNTKDDNISRCLCVFFFWPLLLLWKTKDDNDHKSSSSSPPLVFTPLRHKCHCLHVFSFWLLSLLGKIENHNNHNNHRSLSSSLPPILAPLDIEDNNTSCHLCVFFFWPLSFLWKIEENDDHKSSLSSPLHVITPLRHEDDNIEPLFSCFFLYGLCHSCER